MVDFRRDGHIYVQTLLAYNQDQHLCIWRQLLFKEVKKYSMHVGNGTSPASYMKSIKLLKLYNFGGVQ